MIVTIVSALSVFLQFIGAALALRPMWRGGWSPAWALVSAAMFLWGFSGVPDLQSLLAAAPADGWDNPARFGELAVSCLMVGGIALLSRASGHAGETGDAVGDGDRRLRDVLDNASAVVYVKDTGGRYLFINRRYEELFHTSNEELKGRTDYDIFPRETAEAFRRNDRDVIAKGRRIEREEIVPHPDGLHTYLSVKFPVRLRSGEIYAVCGFSTDITEHKAAQQKLSQAQRMEAIGQLTGGIAHDFNNMLTVLIGNLELLERRVSDDAALDLLQDSQMAAVRGEALTRRLLAYARQQRLNPQPTDINKRLSNMIRLLRRTLGEHIDIETRLDSDIRPAVVDPSQFEDAFLNLALNARDAMAGGGRLTIETGVADLDESAAEETGDSATGPYVTVTVSDTGVGIPRHQLERVFEPFFTTKETGRRSGLGLSMVYGFIRQSGGHVRIDSEVGRGTTVRLFLPPSDTAAEAAETSEPGPEARAGNGETVLVVEDDDDVRAVTRTLLHDLGYRVFDRPNGPETLDLLAQIDNVDLLLVDIVLPGGMSGPELAEEARRRCSGLRVLYMSGYAQAPAESGLPPGDEVLFVQKPFRREQLSREVRRALSAGSA